MSKHTTNEPVANGEIVFPTDEKITGVIRHMGGTQDVLQALDEFDLDETIGLVRAGTCSFASPLLSNDICGLITLEGAPQSHLGILSREYGISAIMGRNALEVRDGLVGDDLKPGTEAYFTAVAEALDGRTVQLDCSNENGDGVGNVIEIE